MQIEMNRIFLIIFDLMQSEGWFKKQKNINDISHYVW